MDPDLEILLELMTEEKLQLEQLIKRYLEENDYKLAYINSKVLQIIDCKMIVLNKLKDPDYYERENLERDKKLYDEHVKNIQGSLISNYWERKLNEIIRRQESIDQKNIKPSIPGQQLDDAFFDVAEGVTESFRFYLKKDQNVYIKTRLVTQGKMELAFTPNVIGENCLFSDKEENSLKALGFTFDPPRQCLTYIYHFQKFTSAGFLKTLFARIVFDVFHYRVDNPATIVLSFKKDAN